MVVRDPTPSSWAPTRRLLRWSLLRGPLVRSWALQSIHPSIPGRGREPAVPRRIGEFLAVTSQVPLELAPARKA